MKPKIITRIITEGDSLTDRGTASKRPILRCFSDLSKSPQGRFTNGYAWSDHIVARFISEFLIKSFKKKGMEATDISDSILFGETKIEDAIQHSYSLDNDLYVKYKGIDFVRSYDEGGLTAHDYRWALSYSPVRFFTRLILSNLGLKRQKLLDYDQEQTIPRAQKEQTLIIEWSGANDLITVNARPSHVEADLAIRARIKNAEELIKNGYRHFVLFNLPDLSLTPRYQALGGAELENAHECTDYFNTELAKACHELSIMYPHCSIEVFDVNSIFTDAYQNPEQYHFAKSKREKPYSTSPDFKINEDGTSPASGYMFWDDVHPSADMHALLADIFYEKYAREYNFSAPNKKAAENEELFISEKKLRAAFVKKYSSLLANQALNLHPDIEYETASLESIFKEGLREETLTHRVITELQWVNSQGKLNLNIPALKEAMARAMAGEERHAEHEAKCF
ncbi:SGNH/GDSL hydrolase family protein [Legionella micdadei]|uniref:SGNH/GDSL hydrolase family protein n=1 Tax=Legionella micdadei TaxID=451 RepID=UPI0009EF7B97|nr:SGNH/GDSL hydrolase family protein [Legionella micdadei]ARG99297.1 hypothetical protein B6V88_02010 [Legionella micdadei]